MARIFISHSSKDNPIAVQLCEWLTAKGWGPVFLDVHKTDGLHAGEEWRKQLERALDLSIAVICVVSKSWLASQECWNEYRRAREQPSNRPRKFIIPLLLDGVVPAELEHGLADYQAITVGAWGEAALKAVESSLSQSGLSPDIFPVNPNGEQDYSVFHGLAPLMESDAAIFFGRDADIAAGMRAMTNARKSAGRQQLVTLRGDSGSGKSSLMHAGLIARLERRYGEFIVLPSIRMQPAALTQVPADTDGRRGLATSLRLAFEAIGYADGKTVEYFVTNPLRESLCALREAYDALYGESDIPRCIVLPIDQAEEALTGGRECDQVLSLLNDVIQQDLHFALLITIRSSDHPKLQSLPLFSREEILVKIEAIPPENLSQVVEGPASKAEPPFQVAPDLLAEIISDLTNGRTSFITGDALPVLALTLSNMAEGARADRILNIDRYNAVGRATGIVQNLIRLVVAKSQSTEAQLIRALVPDFVALSRDGQYIQRQVRHDLIAAENLRLVELMVDAKLLRKSRTEAGGGAGADHVVYELFHESLARLWPAMRVVVESLRNPLQVLERLETSADLWRKGASNIVYRGRTLRDAVTVSKRPEFQNYLSEGARQFLEAGKAARLRLRSLAVAVTALAAFGTFGALSLVSSQATREWAASSVKTKTMPPANLAIAAGFKPGSLVSLFAARGPCEVGEDATFSDCSLRRSGAIEPLIVYKMLDPGNADKSAQLSSDGGSVLVYSKDGKAVLSELSDYTAPVIFRLGVPITAGLVTQTHDLALGTKDGRLVLTGENQPKEEHFGTGAPIDHVLDSGGIYYTFSDDGSVGAWRQGGFAPLFRTQTEATPVENAFISERYQALVAFGNGHIVVMDARTGKPRWDKFAPGIPYGAVADNGNLVVVAAMDQPVRVLRIVDASKLALFSGHDRPVDFVATSDANDMVITADERNVAWVWHGRDGLPVSGPIQLGARVTSAAFARDGRHVAIGTVDGAVHYMDLQNGKEVTRLGGIAEKPVMVKFLDGQRIVIVSNKGTVQVRSLEENGMDSGSRLWARLCRVRLNRFAYVKAFKENEMKLDPGFMPENPDPCLRRSFIF